MKTLNNQLRRAVTLTELLVVLAIISLLATIAVPVYLSQIQRARYATAQSEVRTIAEAEQQVAILHGYFVPIHILDNIGNPRPGDPASSGPRDDFDNLTSRGSHNLIDAYRPLADQIGNQDTLGDSSDKVVRLIDTWQGPFLNPKRIRYDGENIANPGTGDATLDIVVDPWGYPYRFYTDYGVTGEFNAPTSPIDDIQFEYDNLSLNGAGFDEQERFDRFAIVSYGADGITGFSSSGSSAPVEHGDDIYYEFTGIIGNESTYQGF